MTFASWGRTTDKHVEQEEGDDHVECDEVDARTCVHVTSWLKFRARRVHGSLHDVNPPMRRENLKQRLKAPAHVIEVVRWIVPAIQGDCLGIVPTIRSRSVVQFLQRIVLGKALRLCFNERAVPHVVPAQCAICAQNIYAHSLYL